MPTPTANMPMQRKYSTISHTGGCGNPIHTIAWMSTPIAERLATDAAAVWMKLAPCLPSAP